MNAKILKSFKLSGWLLMGIIIKISKRFRTNLLLQYNTKNGRLPSWNKVIKSLNGKYKIKSKYSGLFSDPNFIKLELLYQRPNIFSALRLAHHEIEHSNFFGWLLNPNQTHGLYQKF